MNKNKIAMVVTVLVLIAFVIGCDAKRPSGEIVGMTYNPATTTLMPMTTTDGKIVTTHFVPYTKSEQFIIVVRDCADGTCEDVQWEVSKAEYESYQVGDLYNGGSR